MATPEFFPSTCIISWWLCSMTSPISSPPLWKVASRTYHQIHHTTQFFVCCFFDKSPPMDHALTLGGKPELLIAYSLFILSSIQTSVHCVQPPHGPPIHPHSSVQSDILISALRLKFHVDYSIIVSKQEKMAVPSKSSPQSLKDIIRLKKIVV